jgi:hypothetical protein
MPRGFGVPRAEVASCDTTKLRPVRPHCSPVAGKGFPMPAAGSKLRRPVAAGRWGQPQAGKGFPQPVAVGRRSPKGW